MFPAACYPHPQVARGGVVYTPPLDAVTSKVREAFSLQRLFAGNAESLEVRRSSDSTAQAINTLDSGEFDAAGFATWIGGGSGFVRTAYDQKSTNNAVQTTAGNQPGITTASSINGRPALTFDGSSSQSVIQSAHGPAINTGDFELWIVCRPATTSGTKCIAVFGGLLYFYTTVSGNGKGGIYMSSSGTQNFNIAIAANTNYLLRFYRVSGTIYLDVNGTPAGSSFACTDNLGALPSLRWGEAGTEQFSGQSTFIATFGSALTTGERDALKTALATIYGLTVA